MTTRRLGGHDRQTDPFDTIATIDHLSRKVRS
jgi:hypothetical protein